MDHFIWNVTPEIFSIGPITVRWYGLLFATGFICGYYLMRWIYRRENKNVEELENLLLYVAAGTVIGARLGHCLFYDPAFYLSHPWKILAIWEGGLASHGGGLGVLIAVYIYCRKHAVPFLWLMDRLAITVALAGSFIRLGNVFNSEILGKATDVPWAIVFQRVDSVPRHPVQLYESLSYAVIFLMVLLIYKFFSDKLKNGFLLGVTIVLIISARIVLEFFKMPQAHYQTGLDLSVGQLLSIPYLIAGFVFIYLALRKGKKE
ncbi:MAG: prolipoprotein diacylglyceryl transferase [Gammaproteobacteria bacterium]|jgi:prolipoprotein diacylglyceryl transferase